MQEGVGSGSGSRVRVSAEASAGRVVLRVEGRLTASDLALVESACGEAREQGADLALELSGLRSLDDEAAAGLAALARSGVELVGASGFVTALLRSAVAR